MQDESRITELINADLDGTLSGTERAELSRRLLQDPAARRLHEDLHRSDELLRGVAGVEPPAGLRQSILASLPQAAATEAADPRESGWSRFRYAASIAAGLVVVGLGYGLMQQGADPTGLKGSVATLPAPAPAGIPPARAMLSGGGFAGSARLERVDGGLRLEVTTDAAAPVEISARFDPAQMSPLGTAPGGEPGEIQLPAAGGPGVQSVDFAWAGRDVARVRIELRSGGRSLSTAELSLPAGG